MARRISWWKVVSVVGLGVVVARGGGTCNGGCKTDAALPDEQLAGHFRALCEIAADGIDAPEAGVKHLMRYHGDHGPAMLEDFGATLVIIERIDDDTAHDRRARAARDRLHAPLVACQATWQQFSEAVENDPAASQHLERGMERLGRTLGILLGEDAALRRWPLVIGGRLDAALTPRR